MILIYNDFFLPQNYSLLLSFGSDETLNGIRSIAMLYFRCCFKYIGIQKDQPNVHDKSLQINESLTHFEGNKTQM